MYRGLLLMTLKLSREVRGSSHRCTLVTHEDLIVVECIVPSRGIGRGGPGYSKTLQKHVVMCKSLRRHHPCSMMAVAYPNQAIFDHLLRQTNGKDNARSSRLVVLHNYILSGVCHCSGSKFRSLFHTSTSTHSTDLKLAPFYH